MIEIIVSIRIVLGQEKIFLSGLNPNDEVVVNGSNWNRRVRFRIDTPGYKFAAQPLALHPDCDGSTPAKDSACWNWKIEFKERTDQRIVFRYTKAPFIERVDWFRIRVETPSGAIIDSDPKIRNGVPDPEAFATGWILAIGAAVLALISFGLGAAFHGS